MRVNMGNNEKHADNGNTQLFIHKGDRNLVVDQWAAGDLGMDLSGGATGYALPSIALTLVGDHPAIDFDGAASGVQPNYDANGNLKTDYGRVQFRQSIFYGTTGNDAANDPSFVAERSAA